MIVVLPALGGDTISPRWTLPMGDRGRTMRGVGSDWPLIGLEVQFLVGKERRQILKARAQTCDLGSMPADAVHAEECRVLFVTGRRAKASNDGVGLGR